MAVLVVFPKEAQHQPATPAAGKQAANHGDVLAAFQMLRF